MRQAGGFTRRVVNLTAKATCFWRPLFKNDRMWGNIRLFGLSYHDFPTMLWNVNVLLRAIALNIDPRDQQSPSLASMLWLLINITSYYYVYLMSMVWFVFWRCRDTGDVLPGIIVFSLGITSQISMSKLLWMFSQRRNIRKMIVAFLSCDSTVVPNSRFSFNLDENLRKLKKRAIVLWLVIMFNGVVYVTRPLFKSGRHLLEDDFIFFGSEPMLESPNYELAYTVNTIAVFAACYPASTVTAFFMIIAGYTEAQMLALSTEVTSIWDDAREYFKHDHESTEKRRQMNVFVKKRLEDAVKIHTMNIDLMKQMENVFRGAIAFEFVFLIIGIIASLLGGLENTYIELPFATILVANDCVTGQRIKDACVIFERAVYDSKWENFDVVNRKIVLLMLQNAQKEMVLSAGGLATLSLQRLMGVLRMTYSAYTTLRSTI